MDKPAPTNILLVDDRAERLLALKTVLEPLGQNLVPAESGNAALREILRRDFSVILLDVHMPDLDGFETARLIRERKKSAHTPIVFVTGSQEWEDMERAYSLGAVDFISVPLNPRVLRAKVSVFVDLFQMTVHARMEEHARIQEEEARKRAEAENQAKDDFLATVSHELRTPLTPILATIQMLEADPDPKLLREALHVMRRNLELEARLIDDLLDLTRIRTGKLNLHLETVNVHNSLKRAVETCEALARSKDVTLTLETNAAQSYVQGDAARLQQVFWNLISNATKFTPAGGAVVVRTANPDPDQVRVDVVDTGIGIDPHDLGQVFNRFMQFSRGLAPQGGTGGLGLGLAISKSLVDSHHGQIWAASLGRGRGTTFSAQFATTSPQSNVTGEVSSPDQSPREPLRILLVDDHRDTREALQKLLARRGYQVETADCVKSAIELAESKHFDLLVSDIGLPDGSGHDIMQALKESQNMPGIALSGFGMQQDIERSKAAGFREHLTKPVNFSLLQAAIQRQQNELAV